VDSECKYGSAEQQAVWNSSTFGCRDGFPQSDLRSNTNVFFFATTKIGTVVHLSVLKKLSHKAIYFGTKQTQAQISAAT
jgi:hypothetical protein